MGSAAAMVEEDEEAEFSEIDAYVDDDSEISLPSIEDRNAIKKQRLEPEDSGTTAAAMELHNELPRMYIQRVQATVSVPKPITGEQFSKHLKQLPALLLEQEQANRAMLSENIELPARETQFDESARWSIAQTLFGASYAAGPEVFHEDFPNGDEDAWLTWPLEKFYNKLNTSLRQHGQAKGQPSTLKDGLPRIVEFIKTVARWENLNIYNHMENIEVFASITREMHATFGQPWLKDQAQWNQVSGELRKLILQAIGAEGWAAAGSFPRTRGRHNVILGGEIKREYLNKIDITQESTWMKMATQLLLLFKIKNEELAKVRPYIVIIKFDEAFRQQELRNTTSAEHLSIHWPTALQANHDVSSTKNKGEKRGYKELESGSTTTKTHGHQPSNGKPSGSKQAVKASPKAATDASQTPYVKCNACGRGGHTWQMCKLRTCKPPHPDHNTQEHVLWADSATGVQWLSRSYKTLPARKTLDRGNPTGYVAPELPRKEDSTKCDCNCMMQLRTAVDSASAAQLARIHETCLDGTILHPVTLLPLLNVHVMLDTGSIPANFISRRIVDIARPLGLGAEKRDRVRINGAMLGSSAMSDSVLYVCLALQGDVVRTVTKNEQEVIVKTNMRCLQTDQDITLGIEAIAHNKTLRDICHKLLEHVAHAENTAACAGTRSQFRVTEISQPEYSLQRDSTVDNANYITNGEVQPSHEKMYTTTESGQGDDDDLPDQEDLEEDDELPWETPSDLTTATSFLPTRIEGTEEFKQQQINLCVKMKAIFSKELRKEPAKVEAMCINIDEAKWNVPENRRPPRNQGSIRNQEVNKQVKTLLDKGIIRVSRATAYSQVLLVKKPDQSWRFCIDYRRLNLNSIDSIWPLPNIIHMIDRLGRKRASYFAIVDLTNGFYQAPLSEKSKHLTAFITPDGLYEWNRVAMGLSGAPSFFQRTMVTQVLAGIIQQICEAYMDDVIIYGRTKEEYLNNLHTVFQRMAKFGITVRPDKCKLGLETITYVGHTIDHEGAHFDKEKFRKVIDFPKPRTQGEMRSFLGLANFFRRHVKDHSTLAQPLHEMITNGKLYKKSTKLHWDEKNDEAFRQLQLAVSTCPKLFFLSDDNNEISGAIHLFTDASDIGYGAFLAQEREGNQVPIQFISHTFTKEQKKWGVNEREAYGMFASIIKLKYLLRDVPFHLHTDHRNLTFIKENIDSDRVYRWKMKLQEYRFTLHHIEGKLNNIADFMSRNNSATRDTYQSPEVVTNYFAQLTEIHDIATVEQEWDDNAVIDESIPDEAYEKIGKVHNAVAGHHKVENTLLKLDQAGYYWPNRREHVKRFIKECDLCQKMSIQDHPIVTHPYTTGGHFPFETISMDSMGPFTEDIYGNKYIIAFICTMTRFLNMYAAKSASAEDAAQALLSHSALYGMPNKLQSDGGAEYANEVIEQFTLLVGAERIITLAYSHQEQSIIERSNKETGRWIREMVYERKQAKNTWSQMIPFAIRIHNATTIKTIGYSPAELVYGNSIDLNRNIFVPIEQRPKMNIVDYMAEKLEQQDTALSTAQALAKAHDDKHIAQNPVSQTEFAPHSYVLLAWPITRMNATGRPSKFDTMFRGPYEVISNKGRSYVLKDLVLNKNIEPKTVHQLRPFYYDPRRTNPLDVALKDYKDLWIVEKILNHRGVWRKKSQMTFEVKWVGYPKSTWQPWNDVRDNEELHKYLKKQKKENLIPARFQNYSGENTELNNMVTETQKDPWLGRA